jgi:two-component system, LuxR family, response regulator FixJ
MSTKLDHSDHRRKSVFIVDDDASVRDSLRVLLSALGFEVSTHDSGRQCLADERRYRAGCFIVDHHMPGMDGLELITALRREGTDAPAILMTGRLDPSIAKRAASIGVQTILEKPFAVSSLLDLIQENLGAGEDISFDKTKGHSHDKKDCRPLDGP